MLSDKTAQSTQLKAVLNLGKKIVEELELQPTVDTLGRWMAHYIAELIYGIENADVNEKAEKQEVCARAILELWAHRQKLPDGSRPFENLEAILGALESLDPKNDSTRYFPKFRRDSVPSSETGKAQQWLDMVSGLDEAAKLLIRYCLLKASEEALDKEEAWANIAKEIGEADIIQLHVIKFISYEDSIMGEKDPNEDLRGEIEDRVKKLEMFQQSSKHLLTDLKNKLEILNVDGDE